MKRVLWMMLTFALLLCGCGGPTAADPAEYDLSPVLAANQVETLVEQYDSYTIHAEYPDGTSADYYMDRDSFFYSDGLMHYLFTPEEQCEVSTEPGMEFFDRHINPFGEDLAAQWRADYAMNEESQYEKVTSWEEGDGVLSIQTTLESSHWSPDLAQMGYLGKEGDVYVCEYTVDAQTLLITHSTEYILWKDGTQEPMGEVTMAVNEEKPQSMLELMAEAKTIDSLPQDQTRTVTCVIDPGSTEERTVSKTVLLGSYVLLPEDWRGYALFLDAEGTQPASGLQADVFQDDFTVYAIQTADAT